MLFAAALAIASGAAAQPSKPGPTPAEIVQRHSLPLALIDGQLSGPGADLLLRSAGEAQFAIVIEPHNDHVTPLVTRALFHALHDRHGYNYVAIEQDMLGMEAASSPARRGRLSKIADHARTYPYSYTFSTDEELQLLADVGSLSTGRWKPVWGFDQLFGATLPLEELHGLAASPAARAAVGRLLMAARRTEGLKDKHGNRDQAKGHFTSGQSAQILSSLEEISRLMNPAPGSREAELIAAIRSSAEIYSYYDPKPPLDAVGTPRGLLNNTVREELMKRVFMRNYRMAEAADQSQPKVVVKGGSYHTLRGLSDNGVYTLGNFLHEFAIANGSGAVSVQVLALREWWPTYDKMDPVYRALLPSGTMDRGTLVDLRPLRAHFHAGEWFGLQGMEARKLRQLVFGMDFALFMPSKPGAHSLTAVASAK